MYKGNCYATSEALYHLLGGKKAGWKPMHMTWEDISHWFIQHKSGIILDATVLQFNNKPDYSKAKGCGFLTKEPSNAAKELMEKLVWKNNGTTKI